jgi:hypothetical protein
MIKHKGPDPTAVSKEYWFMREAPIPSLFEAAAMPPVMPIESSDREEKRSHKLATDFIRWCFGFGNDFRNSPDIINLHSFLQKTHLKLKDSEELELLVEARRLYVKKVEQMMKKADKPMLTKTEPLGVES